MTHNNIILLSLEDSYTIDDEKQLWELKVQHGFQEGMVAPITHLHGCSKGGDIQGER